jgi:hypothetical protein
MFQRLSSQYPMFDLEMNESEPKNGQPHSKRKINSDILFFIVPSLAGKKVKVWMHKSFKPEKD